MYHYQRTCTEQYNLYNQHKRKAHAVKLSILIWL